MCQLYNSTNQFCRRQLELGVPKVRYVKQAAECLGLQRGSKVWVLYEHVQLNDNGKLIPNEDSKFIWLGPMVNSRSLAIVAPASDAATVPMQSTPLMALDVTLTSLQLAVDNNFLPAFFVLASAGMALHYEVVLEMYGMCPTPVAIGFKNSGKSTAARTALALLGTPQFFVREFTATQTSVLSSRKTFPTVFDDPDDLSKCKSFTFNAGARATSRSVTVSRSTGIITLNLDRIRCLCSNYKYVFNYQ